jgi:hypothetical protein
MLLAKVVFGTAACRFDEAGPSTAAPIERPDAAPPGAPPDAAPIIDAPPPDAERGCRDRDGDGFMSSVGGAECGELDCDDGDPRAFPGQEDAFTDPRSDGSFDFDCDGGETMSAAFAGQDCYWDWGECRGSGWTSEMPECGEVGVWHWCEDNGWDCVETSSFDAAMPCR